MPAVARGQTDECSAWARGAVGCANLRHQAAAQLLCASPTCANLRQPAPTCSLRPVCLQLFNVWVEPEVVVDVRQEGALDLIFESGEAR